MESAVLSAVRDGLIAQAGRQHEGFSIVLHGGEPLLLGFDGLATLLYGLRSRLRQARYPLSVQTNGVLLSNRLLDLFAETRTTVSVSIDGPAGANDIGRLDHKGESSYKSTMKGIRLLQAHPESDFLFAGTISVIQPEVDPIVVYSFLKELGTPSMDFLFQDGNHDHYPPGKSNFLSTEYGQWLSVLFDIYLADSSPVPIRIIDDIVKLCLGGQSRKEGQGTSPYGILIIETDGSIRKNDTLRSSYDGADLFKTNWNIQTTTIGQVLVSQEFTDYSKLQYPISVDCRQCSLLSICGGGMPLYRWSTNRSYDNPSVYCHDHSLLIRHVLTNLAEHGLETSIAQPR